MLRPEQVRLGRENRDICIRLKDDIEKAHREYDRRFKPIMDHPVDYFYRWMVEILADGDSNALGDYPYATTAENRGNFFRHGSSGHQREGPRPLYQNFHAKSSSRILVSFALILCLSSHLRRAISRPNQKEKEETHAPEISCLRHRLQARHHRSRTRLSATPEDAAAQKELALLARDLHRGTPGAYEKLAAFANKNNASVWGQRAALALGYDDYSKNHAQQALIWLAESQARHASPPIHSSLDRADRARAGKNADAGEDQAKS